jgi:hypothetical protein
MDANRAPAGGGRAALAQGATLAVTREASLSGRGKPGLIASLAGDRAGLLVDLESWMANPPGTAVASGAGLIVWVWPRALPFK